MRKEKISMGLNLLLSLSLLYQFSESHSDTQHVWRREQVQKLQIRYLKV